MTKHQHRRAHRASPRERLPPARRLVADSTLTHTRTECDLLVAVTAAIDSTVFARSSRSGPIRFRHAAESESLSQRRARADAEEGVPARFRIHAIPET